MYPVMMHAPLISRPIGGENTLIHADKQTQPISNVLDIVQSGSEMIVTYLLTPSLRFDVLSESLVSLRTLQQLYPIFWKCTFN